MRWHAISIRRCAITCKRCLVVRPGEVIAEKKPCLKLGSAKAIGSSFAWARGSIAGVVKEDRGPIGVKGRHLYLVEFRPESLSESLSVVELPADQLQSVTG